VTSILAAGSTSTPSWATVVSALVGLASGVAAVIGSFLIANRQSRATIEQANKTASASIESAKEQAIATIEAAQAASGAETFVPTSARYADWQMHKRKVYEELLNALAQHSDQENNESRGALQRACNRALLVAEPTLRAKLYELIENFSQMEDSAERRKMVELMSLDVERGT